MKVPVKIVFDDWKHTETNKSVYQTELGLKLSIGNLHSGTTFDAVIYISDDDYEKICKAANDNGVRPYFYVLINNKTQTGK